MINYRYDFLNYFSLVLVGEPCLNHILEKQMHEALRQRRCIVIMKVCQTRKCRGTYSINWSWREEAVIYWMEGAISVIHGYSEGNARKIDNLMTDALTLGAQQDKQTIAPPCKKW